MNTDNNQPTRRASMTDHHTDHRYEAERMLADADAWASVAGELIPEASELSCLNRAQLHALFAIHDTLTTADRYFANEAKQREAVDEPEMSEAAEWLSRGGPDPLDEDDHRDRLTSDRRRIVRHGRGHWHTPAIYGKWCDADCTEMSLRDWARVYGPLTFAPEPPPEDSSTHYYPTNIDRAPDGTAWSWGVAECHCNRPWRHE